jgi:hypothetical protein
MTLSSLEKMQVGVIVALCCAAGIIWAIIPVAEIEVIPNRVELHGGIAGSAGHTVERITFTIINRSSTAVIVNNVEGSCACIQPEIRQLTVKPGACESIDVLVDNTGLDSGSNKEVFFFAEHCGKLLSLRSAIASPGTR